ncbi:MAG TPA: DNA (cytosine-5-)-methyltransferase [Flavobacteriales bacterium]|jgi:DNA (cytosine-5)-methyltransferase 1|nr:DNA (cytosine-5-)-methyltransferase [Flavobacteriales bacterium]
MPRRAKPAASAPLRVAELFAGVGGFRIGLERAGGYQVVWSDQWEPGKKKQHASDIYVARFGAEGHVCEDIATVKASDIPDHDLLVGGFPCQDYSVATTLRNAKGLLGKKGVLWWQIQRLLDQHTHKPQYLLLENVDRLLGSPAGQRGRDFALMLNSLNTLGYAVEWRVINAADYGMPQRRRRVFIFGWRDAGAAFTPEQAAKRLAQEGLFASTFPMEEEELEVRSVRIDGDLAQVSKSFNKKGTVSPFLSAGVMRGGVVYTAKPTPQFTGTPVLLGDVLQPELEVPRAFFVPKTQLARWRYLKGAKKEARTASNGRHNYHYSEGAMAFPDLLDKPARTIITGEGGPSPSRFKHVVRTPSGRFRRLTPVELERLNMFPDDHTAGAPDGWRAFFMGNALVTGVVERLARELTRRHARSAE